MPIFSFRSMVMSLNNTLRLNHKKGNGMRTQPPTSLRSRSSAIFQLTLKFTSSMILGRSRHSTTHRYKCPVLESRTCNDLPSK